MSRTYSDTKENLKIILLSCKYFLDQSRQKAIKINIIVIKTIQNSAYCSAIVSCCDPLINPRTLHKTGTKAKVP